MSLILKSGTDLDVEGITLDELEKMLEEEREEFIEEIREMDCMEFERLVPKVEDTEALRWILQIRLDEKPPAEYQSLGRCVMEWGVYEALRRLALS